MERVKIIFKTKEVLGDIELFKDSKTVQAIYNKLPIESKLNIWGEELYFKIPIHLKPENTTLNVKFFDVAYWPEGDCMCIFLGKTPISDTDKPKPASEVEIIGRALMDKSILNKIKQGEKIVLIKD